MAATRALVAASIVILAGGVAMAGGYAAAGGPGPGQPLDRKTALDGIQTQVNRFKEAAAEYRGTVSHIVQQEYKKKRKELTAHYQSQVDETEKDEKVRRESAILLFENFLAKYPTDERWTPDAMFRLAELYFEKANDEYLTATAAAQQSGSTAEIKPDYLKTIDLYKGLIARFPSYRLIDGAYYLMGWCLGEMGKEGESLVAMQALTCANKHNPLDAPPVAPTTPPRKGEKFEDPYADCTPVKESSRFLPEAWTRIGEYHFDNNELEKAIAAYMRVIEFKDSPYYDKALYKLAWSYYRNDKYPDAIKRFDELVVYSDKKKGETGAEGSDLRTESIQYLGISFAEKDWNGDQIDDAESGLERAQKFYRGREQEPHVREVFAKLGDIYFDETEFFRAIAVYKWTLDRWPYHPDNPKLQDRVVMAFERQRDFNNALKEREVLAKKYLKGSDWYKHNRDNKAATDAAAELAEYALIQAAVNHHKAAQDLKNLAKTHKNDPKIYENIAKEYALAAEAYEKYLDQYPNSKNTYEYAYSYAETLYFSGRFADAARAYERVRDSNLDNKYAEDSAFNAVKSYEKELEIEATAGRYKEPPMPKVGETKSPVTPMTVPELALKLQSAYDTFVRAVPTSGRVPTMAYKAAEIDYRYLHWDAARPRMEQLVAKYCKDGDIGANAGNAIIVSYTVENNLDKLDEWANKLKTMACGGKEIAAKNAADLGKLSLGIKFKRADQLFADKKFEEAAKLYVQIVDADPKGEDSDKALNNAAVAYENVKRFAAATRLYERIVSEYPQSKFVDDALFRTAVSYQKGFEFDKAVVSYAKLAEDPHFAQSPHRTDAVYNAAVILENDQSYSKAAELFRRYSADKSVKRDDQAEASFRAALIYEKMKQPDQTIKAMTDYIKTFGSDPKGGQRVLEAYFKIALAHEAKHDRRGADDIYKRIVAMGSTVQSGSGPAEFAAHASFILTEERLPSVEKAKISGGGKKLQDSIAAFQKNVTDMVSEYSKILNYKRANWTLAAYFRTGYLFETFSKALLAAPCPPEVKKLGPEGCDVYREAIEQSVAKVDEEAVKRYGVTLEQAGKLGVSNEWTKLARLRANQYKPDLFPMVKDEHIGMEQP